MAHRTRKRPAETRTAFVCCFDTTGSCTMLTAGFSRLVRRSRRRRRPRHGLFTITITTITITNTRTTITIGTASTRRSSPPTRYRHRRRPSILSGKSSKICFVFNCSKIIFAILLINNVSSNVLFCIY